MVNSPSCDLSQVGGPKLLNMVGLARKEVLYSTGEGSPAQDIMRIQKQEDELGGGRGLKNFVREATWCLATCGSGPEG